MNLRKFLIFICSLFLSRNLFSLDDDSILIDFRNQKISDIIYSVADICEESVFVDETVTGTATFHFEDDNFEKALDRFASFCHLYVEKNNNVYHISKVKLKLSDNKVSLNTENVMVEPLLNMLSRVSETTIMYDNLPNAAVTIRVSNVSLEDVLNLCLVKLPGYGLERISSGFYITKSSASNSRRNIDVFTLSEVNGAYSISIQKGNFATIIESLFRKSKKECSVLAKPGIQFENLNYTDKSFESLLHLLLEQANCDFQVIDEIYYIFDIQRKDILKKLKETRFIQLKNITTELLIALLPVELNSSSFIKVDKTSNIVILSGSRDEIEPIENFIEKIDVKSEEKKFTRFELKHIAVTDAINSIPKNMLHSDLIVIPNTNSFVTQSTEEQKSELMEFISLIDNKTTSKAVKLKYIKSDELIKNLPPSVSKDDILATLDASLVFFNGSEDSYNVFLKDLELIDKPKQQIRYQILVIQRQKTKGSNWTSSLNANTTTENGSYAISSVLSSIFNIQFDIISQFGIQFAGSLNAELSQGKSHVLADTTLNGISGQSISFSNTNTYRYRDIIVDKTGDVYTSTTREIASGLTLSIDGWVSGDDMVTVSVDAQVSKQGSSDSTSDTTNPPATSEKKVSTNVRTRSGTPVIIGGLFQQESDTTEKKVPVLGSIPGLGLLFKTKTVSIADTEFIIYLVPFVEKSVEQQLTVDANIKRLSEKYLLCKGYFDE